MFDVVLGAGQGGCRIAREFSRVYKLEGWYMNLSDLDFGMLKILRSHTLVVGDGHGTGRDPVLGEKLVRSDTIGVREFLREAVPKTAKRVVLCVGGGGGSGTGFLFPVLEYLIRRKLNVLLIYTLPQRAEGLPAKPNALKALNRIIANYVGQGKEKSEQIALLLVDNDFCRSRYVDRKGSYWQVVNRAIAISLHRFFKLTDLEAMGDSDMTAGYGALDLEEVYRTLFFKDGFLDVREFAVTEEVAEEGVSAIRNVMKTSSLVCGSLDLRTTKAYIVSIAVPSKWKKHGDAVIENVFAAVQAVTKTPYVLRSSFFDPRLHNKARVTVLCAGLARSHSLDKILKQTLKDAEKYTSKQDVESLDLSGIDDIL